MRAKIAIEGEKADEMVQIAKVKAAQTPKSKTSDGS